MASRTIFIGGGTPTHAQVGQLERYVTAVRDAGDIAPSCEFTIEANPGTLSAAKVAALRRVGVNRVSLGAQSFDETHLRTLGRIHTADDVVRSVAAVRDGGIDAVSLDLILAIPGQTLTQQERDLARLIELAPDHCSTYVLTFEEGTEFTQRMRAGRLPAPDADRDLAHLHMACERLVAAGFRRYEISNFAQPGAESRHNLAYWRNADWLGIGAGAHSHVRGVRWRNVVDPQEYVLRVQAGEAPIDYEEAVTPDMRLFESMMMGLRLVDGVDLDEVQRATRLDPRSELATAIGTHRAAGLLAIEGATMRLTEQGLDLADYVIRSFVPEAPLPD